MSLTEGLPEWPPGKDGSVNFNKAVSTALSDSSVDMSRAAAAAVGGRITTAKPSENVRESPWTPSTTPDRLELSRIGAVPTMPVTQRQPQQDETDAISTMYNYVKDVINVTMADVDVSGRQNVTRAAEGYAALAKDPVYLLNRTQPTMSSSVFVYLNDSWLNGTNMTLPEVDNTSMGLEERVGLPPDWNAPYLSGYTWPHIIVAAIVVSIVIIFIVVGNALVMIAIAQDRNLNQVQNYFIGSLAMSDFLLGLLIMPLSLANELMGYWHFGEMLCDMWLSVDVLLCTASILNLCLISLDRYWSVTRAVSYVRQRTRKRAFVMITLVWLLSAVICFPPLAGWKRPQPKEYGFALCVLSEEVGYVVYSTMGSFYIPLAVMVIVYFKIYLAARSRARRNLKKRPPIPIAPTNGKSTSSSTTTSFTQQQNKAVNTTMTNAGVAKDDLSCIEDEEIEDLPPAEENADGTGTDSFDPDPEMGQSIKMSVTNHNAHFKPLDEKRKLLSEDTDTDVGETPKHGMAGAPGQTHRKTQLSEDTEDSAPECYCNQYTDYRVAYPNKGQHSEDNLKPLLEDSQAESESQRESDVNCSSRLQTAGSVADGCRTLEMVAQSSPDVGLVPTVCVEPLPAKEAAETPTKKKRKAKFNLHSKPNGLGSKSKRMDLLSPTSIRKLSLRRHNKDKPSNREDPDRLKRKIARAKERRAILVLGIIMVTFIICWLPFFSLYLISILTGLDVPRMVFAVIFWAGYCNSALNPIIYTIFNREFRVAFQKILCGRRCR